MKRMLSAPEIYLYRHQNVDFRKSINGFVAITESDTDLPFGSNAPLLSNQKNTIKSGLYLRGRVKQASPCGINASKKTRTSGLQKIKTRCLPSLNLTSIDCFHTSKV
ncbi:hypothetical protein [uncultured Vibrio sp.]|uniref:hypothetical protein n=1 Tax=uncultured Vibrio sp. TaxID=114054 RepID=UPI00091B515E|nr:hypothetical protein [uncultured Vibrio sp.]OIQ25322.1 MAG: hypothetical protein BM561_06025 [Vibrio sp. MedPE-SWchi]